MSSEFSGNRLLVVDDEPEVGALIKKAAESCGFEVVVTDDPDSFIKIARTFRPTVITLDLNIPNTDGVQLMRLLAADRCTADLILSSGAEGKVLEAVMRLGRERGLKMSGALPKPFRMEALRELLTRFSRIPKKTLAGDLADALKNGNLFLEYQLKLDCGLGLFTGVEALARWQHPVHGPIRPDEFIPLAEETDLIHQVTDWAISTAAKQSAIWRTRNLDLSIAVNISAKDVGNLDLPERLDQRCKEAKIETTSIILEITESGAMRHPVQMMDVLTRLRLKGFRLSLDDFGTGYSSLIQLQRLPFSEIKIDQSFVMQMNTDSGCRTIVEIIIDLAKKLGLKSVAEGVEDEDTLNALIDMGCDLAQGYHLSRPVAPDRVPDLVFGYQSPRMGTAA